VSGAGKGIRYCIFYNPWKEEYELPRIFRNLLGKQTAKRKKPLAKN
jgi:hypothetical protein